MTIFQLLLGIMTLIFFFFARDGIQKKKLSRLHFAVLGGGSIMIAILGFNIELLNQFGGFFGIARGADLIVYASIIVLGYLFFNILHKITKQEQSLTSLVSKLALTHSTDELGQIIQTSASIKSGCIVGLRSYNESKTIGTVIENIVLYGFATIVIVDDGSQDQTYDIIQHKQKKYQDSVRIIALRHHINRGPGAANKTLLDAVKNLAQSNPQLQWLITVDADDQMNIADCSKFLDIIKDADQTGIQIILGSRFVMGGQTSNLPKLRKIILWGGQIVTYLFNGIRLSDPHNGFRAYRIPILKHIVITSDRFSYANEINDCIYRQGLHYCEVPVYIKYTDYSLAKGQQTSSALKILKELIYKKFFFG